MAVSHTRQHSSSQKRARQNKPYHAGSRALPVQYGSSTILALLLVSVWAVAGRQSTESSAAATTGHNTSGHSVQPKMPESSALVYENYFVAESTVPGAGLGVFARKHLPVGTMWNIEDAQESGSLVMTRQQWRAMIGLAEHLRSLGFENHPILNMVVFFQIYGYHCDNAFAVSLTASTFTNHGPTSDTPHNFHESPEHHQQHGSHDATDEYKSGRDLASAPPESLSISSSSGSISKTSVRYANTGELPHHEPWVQELTAKHQCTIGITHRDIQAGEEILEDYRHFCYEDDCNYPEFVIDPVDSVMGVDECAASAAASLPKYKVVQLEGFQGAASHVAGSTGPGLFAARDFPTGWVWNKEDAIYSFTVTRGQWASLMRLKEGLEHLGVERPVITNFIDGLRAMGRCCSADDRMYIPLTTSALARSAPAAGGQLANVQAVRDGNKALAAGLATSEVCTWLQTTRIIKKWEEIVEDSSIHACDW